jgi:hypothetical protein
MKKLLFFCGFLIGLFIGYAGYKLIIPNLGQKKQHVIVKVMLKNDQIKTWSRWLPEKHPFILIGSNPDNTYYLKFYNEAHLFGNWGYISKQAVAYKIVEL